MRHEHAVAIVAARFVTPQSSEAEIKEAIRKAADLLEFAAEEVLMRQEVSLEEPHVVAPGGRKRGSYWSTPS